MGASTQILDANEAVASVAYRLSEVVAVYPITPASAMGEWADEWSAAGRPNLWGQVPRIIEMQSEGGAAGALHGALQGGAMATTFTASQGLLLMLPNLFKIAGELTAFCMHVAARTVATHALSIFGDHSDVMAARGTGFALLASGSPQEAQDLAAIGHAASLLSRVPFLHFFDGFRTSHEMQRVRLLDDEVLQALIDPAAVAAHRARALSPDHPVVRGTAHNPDTYFQAREAVNPFIDRCPEVVEGLMQRFGELTGRSYRLYDYSGHPQAERVLVMMGSGAECAGEVIEAASARGERVGLLRVRLYRPLETRRLVQALPPSVRSLAVLDRTKEPGSPGEPLWLDVLAACAEGVAQGWLGALPQVIGGRYGLSSKEFTPGQVEAVLAEMQRPQPRRRFTLGIRDDLTHSSLEEVPWQEPRRSPEDLRAIFYGLGSDGTVSANKSTVKILGEATPLECQAYFVYDSKKSGSMTVSHLRFSSQPIRSTYQIQEADLVAIHDPGLLFKLDLLQRAAPGATVLLNHPGPTQEVWNRLPRSFQQALLKRNCRLFVIDAFQVAQKHGLGRRINTVMQACFFHLAEQLPEPVALEGMRREVKSTWGKRGPEVVRRNLAAIEDSLTHLAELPLPKVADSSLERPQRVPAEAEEFVQRVTRLLLEGQGDRLPVSAFPPDGSWPTGTSRYEKRAIASEIPIWEPELCVQCNRCSTICPHSAILTRVLDPAALTGAPESFRSQPENLTPELADLHYTVQVAPDDCTGCGLCVEVCPAKDRTLPRRKAINMQPLLDHQQREREAFAFFSALPEVPRQRLPRESRTLALLPPLFEFSGACAGCGETPYLRQLTQLFGDRLVLANATGCSSIYGGNLPTTPYTKDSHGRGPAWSNSLFEDNAEFGLGLRLGLDSLQRRANQLVQQLADRLPEPLTAALLCPCASHDEAALAQRRDAIAELQQRLASLEGAEVNELTQLAENLLPRSLWIVGGDGWAYDIGYGGLDHVLAGRDKVNILVLDTEVYSNTGGQQSKATPLGASAKFASAGKESRKKDLGLLAMTYGHVYVASIAMQARSPQTLKAMLEAEAHPGPALLIAHSPCIAHGYDLVHSPAHQRMAIDSGAWPLYRFNPARLKEGLAPLRIDADPATLPLRRYMEEEVRFRMIALRDPERFEHLVREAERAVFERHALYEQLAQIKIPQQGGPDA